MKRLIPYCLLLFSCFSMSNCVSVKAYQKMYLNDSEMELAAKKLESFETNFESYREGAAGPMEAKWGAVVDVINPSFESR